MFKDDKKRRSDEGGEMDSSALADIAFLLLIFFLVATTIDIDTGIGLVLPPPPDPNQKPPPIKDRNMLKILVNSQGMVLIEEEPAAMSEVKQRVVEFVDNKGQNPQLSDSPQKAIVSIKADRQTTYEVYINMLDEVKGAYRTLRNRASMSNYGKQYEALDQEQKEKIKEMYPQKISIAEPDQGS
jgi:biopolymer transport protein ExbD